MKFCTLTLGCKVNQFETWAMENILLSRGHESARAGDGCDVCIINTCTITANSAGKSRRAIRRLKKLEPDAFIGVCGCLSQLESDDMLLLGVELIGGSGNRSEFVDKLEDLYYRFTSNAESHNDVFPYILIDDPGKRKEIEKLCCGLPTCFENSDNIKLSRTRALLKIQDGCNNFCAYCIIPYARGRSRSLSPDVIKDQAVLLGCQGFREIVITGIEISSYGKDLPDCPKLFSVLQSVSDAAPNARIRLGSLDPSLITTEFCDELGKMPNLCDHFHLSVQSGCDETLYRMKRKYRTEDVQNAISLLRDYFPNCGITGDLLVGFPGETDEEFNRTRHFVENAAFSDMHIFPFSARPGTSAAKMPNKVMDSVKKKRIRLISEIASESALSFKHAQIGSVHDVLIESKRNGYWVGYTTNYIEVHVKENVNRNDILKTKIVSVDDGVAFGKFV